MCILWSFLSKAVELQSLEAPRYSDLVDLSPENDSFSALKIKLCTGNTTVNKWWTQVLKGNQTTSFEELRPSKLCWKRTNWAAAAETTITVVWNHSQWTQDKQQVRKTTPRHLDIWKRLTFSFWALKFY